MDSGLKRLLGVLIVLVAGALHATPQAYTISAKPGAVNYVEGNAFLNDGPISDKGLRSVFLNANDTLSTDLGKAEVLLTPGVFLRVGDNSQIRMISPSLLNTQVELDRGEMMIEATGLLKDNTIQVLDHGSVITIEKNGLYRFTGDDPPVAAVLDGKAEVVLGDRKVDLKKGKETVLSSNLTSRGFDPKKDDELYAWSNVRSEYDAAASYRVASNASSGNFGGWYGFGYNGMLSPGWFYDQGFNSYAWLPGSGAFFSPFGYGFYSPGLVGYAPVVTMPVYRGGRWNNGKWNGTVPVNGWHGHGNGVVAAVPVSPNNPAAVGAVTASPFANHVAREQAAQRFAASGFRTGSGAPASSFAGRGASASSTQGGWHGGGGERAASSSGFAGHSSGASSGGGHAGGGHR